MDTLKKYHKMEDKDKIIDDLLEKVKGKKEVLENKLQETIQYRNKTNMMFSFTLNYGMNDRVNLNTLDENQLRFVLMWIVSNFDNMDDIVKLFNLDNKLTYKHHGFDFSEWEGDVLNRIRRLESKRKLTELKEMEDKLNKLMSQEKKELLEITKISEMLSKWN